MNNKLGVMLDCSRNAVMTVSALERFIDTIAKMGYNVLMLYTEDTYEILDEPLFGYLRGRYSIKEIQEIDKYCKERDVELIPCIQTLAHLNQIFKFKRFGEVSDCHDVLLVDEEKTYHLIEKMFKTLSVAFSSREVHVGMDEAYWIGRGAHLDKHGKQPQKEILLRHLNRVVEIANKYNFKPMIWSDMFLPLVKENGIDAEDKAKVPPNLSLVYWDYYSYDRDRYCQNMDKHLCFDRNVWFAGGAWKWQGFHAGNQKSIETITPALSACKEKGFNNVFITMWGDDGNECPAVAVLPALLYASEVYRGNQNLESIKSKFKQIVGENWDEFMSLDMILSDFKKPELQVNGSKAMLYSDPFFGFFDLTVTGEKKESSAFAKMANAFSTCSAKNGKYGYVFESFEKFARLMSVKYDLGYRTRKYYEEKDKRALKNILTDYDLVVTYAEKFLDAFEKMWFTDNKPNGFEVQQVRIGGMIERVKRCKNRLQKFVLGEIECIEELDEKLVPMKETENGLPEWNGYCASVTVNIL